MRTTPRFLPVNFGLALALLLSALDAAAQKPEPLTNFGLAGMNSISEGPRPQTPTSRTTGQSGAALLGTVRDNSGALIPNAKVSLLSGNGKTFRSVLCETGGEFSFTELPAGAYFITIEAKGFAKYKSEEIDLVAQQVYQLPDITLQLDSVSTEVTVRPTEVIAAEQIRAEEKQRFFGVIPNFYTSYVLNPAPMTGKQKFSLASRDSFDPVSLIADAAVAGIQQANHTYAGYGYGASGYGKRFAAQFGNGRTSDFLSHAVFPALFQQDPRYYYQGVGSFRSRLLHAASFAILTRSDSGKPMPNYSYFLGDLGSGALSNLYYPHADRGVGLVFTNAAIGIAGKAGEAILREFFSKRITTNVPPAATP